MYLSSNIKLVSKPSSLGQWLCYIAIQNTHVLPRSVFESNKALPLTKI